MNARIQEANAFIQALMQDNTRMKANLGEESIPTPAWRPNFTFENLNLLKDFENSEPGPAIRPEDLETEGFSLVSFERQT